MIFYFRMTIKAKAAQIADLLDAHYPQEIQFLHFRNNFELLIAVILSAQTTDEQVMRVVPALFARFPSPEKMAKADIPVLEKLIHATGFFHAKAKNIKAASQKLLELYDGTVPNTIEELVKLPGVGRKTANVIQAVIFQKARMAVDTHVFRVSHRIGLVSDKCTTPLSVERELTRHLPDEIIPTAHHWLILHGRYVCQSRTPHCEKCGLKAICKDFLSARLHK